MKTLLFDLIDEGYALLVQADSLGIEVNLDKPNHTVVLASLDARLSEAEALVVTVTNEEVVVEMHLGRGAIMRVGTVDVYNTLRQIVDDLARCINSKLYAYLQLVIDSQLCANGACA